MTNFYKNNYTPLELIPCDDHPKLVPDIILYPTIYDEDTIKKTSEMLDTMSFDKNNQIWIADNPGWIYGADLPIQPFPYFIEQILLDIEKITGRSFNTCLVSKYQGNHTHIPWNKTSSKFFGKKFITPSISFGSSMNMIFTSKKIIKEVNIPDGSLVIERESVKKYWKSSIQNQDKELFYYISFFRIYSEDIKPSNISQRPFPIKKLPVELSNIYLSSRLRDAFSRKIKRGLYNIKTIPEGSQCFMKNGLNQMSKYITIQKFIAAGDWGNVFNVYLTKDTTISSKFAIKMSRITEDDFKDPYSESSSSWYEIWMLKDIIRPMIKKNICPNLPLFIDTFLCDKCDFTFSKGDKTLPCIITAVELGSGDLRDYLKFGNPSDKELFSALFQIMAGLHAIQMSGQILNNDIKAKNILFYNVKPGGYWHYMIDNHNFYVPNYGKMFVLNDFGVSTLYNPNFQLYPNTDIKTFNLGSRFAININETFSPIVAKKEYNKGLINTKDVTWLSREGTKHISKGATYKIDRQTGQVIISNTVLTPIQKSYLFKHGITTNPKKWGFFEHPNIIPPFEFYNDVQDVLRTFIGGKRTTQSGNHTLYPIISKRLYTTIKPFMGLAENAKERTFSLEPYHILAGSFIKMFFKTAKKYQTKPSGKKISYYDMNKCCKNYNTV
jgi:hypothetical protein